MFLFIFTLIKRDKDKEEIENKTFKTREEADAYALKRLNKYLDKDVDTLEQADLELKEKTTGTSLLWGINEEEV